VRTDSKFRRLDRRRKIIGVLESYFTGSNGSNRA
jgi:hypothetical protein